METFGLWEESDANSHGTSSNSERQINVAPLSWSSSSRPAQDVIKHRLQLQGPITPLLFLSRCPVFHRLVRSDACQFSTAPRSLAPTSAAEGKKDGGQATLSEDAFWSRSRNVTTPQMGWRAALLLRKRSRTSCAGRQVGFRLNL